MPWAESRPGGRGYVNPKYRDPQHGAERQRHLAALQAAGSGKCAEIICKQPTRLITPDMDLHLCHDRTTGRVLGLGHAQCNRSEAARWARTRQTATRLRW